MGSLGVNLFLIFNNNNNSCAELQNITLQCCQMCLVLCGVAKCLFFMCNVATFIYYYYYYTVLSSLYYYDTVLPSLLLCAVQVLTKTTFYMSNWGDDSVSNVLSFTCDSGNTFYIRKSMVHSFFKTHSQHFNNTFAISTYLIFVFWCLF